MYKNCFEDENSGELCFVVKPCHYMTIKEALDVYQRFDEFLVQKIV